MNSYCESKKTQEIQKKMINKYTPKSNIAYSWFIIVFEIDFTCVLETLHRNAIINLLFTNLELLFKA